MEDSNRTKQVYLFAYLFSDTWWYYILPIMYFLEYEFHWIMNSLNFIPITKVIFL